MLLIQIGDEKVPVKSQHNFKHEEGGKRSFLNNKLFKIKNVQK